MGRRCDGCPHNKVIKVSANGHQWFGCLKPFGTDCPYAPKPRTRGPRFGPVKAFIRWALLNGYIDNFTDNIDKETERIYNAYLGYYKKSV